MLLENRGEASEHFIAERQPEVDENGEFLRLQPLNLIEFDRMKPSQPIG